MLKCKYLPGPFFSSDTLRIVLNKAVLAVALLLVFSPVHAAEVTFIAEGPEDTHAVFIQGPIEAGDYNKVVLEARKMANQGTPLTFSLNSTGGNFLEAIKIGQLIKKLNAKTTTSSALERGIGKPYRCYSACFIILASGSMREPFDNMSSSDEFSRSGDIIKQPAVGIHRPYVKPEDYAQMGGLEARELYAKIETLTREYLATVSVPQSIIDQMFAISSREMYLMSRPEFGEKIGFTQPFYEEWIYAKCGGLSPEEDNDLTFFIGMGMYTTENPTVPRGYSMGYIDHLWKEMHRIRDCKKTTNIEHQKKVLAEIHPASALDKRSHVGESE